MLYHVKVSPAESDLLASVIGQPLERVTTDGWAVELQTPDAVLSITPEEFATPDADHPYGDVERPTVRANSEPRSTEHTRTLAERLGLIRAVNIISTMISFSPVVCCPPEKILGVQLPASRGHGWVYFSPAQREEAEREVGTGSLVDLDIGFELVADGCPSLVVYTRGFFVMASPLGLPNTEDWVSFGTYVRHPAK